MYTIYKCEHNINGDIMEPLAIKLRPKKFVFIKSQKNPYRQCEKVLDLMRYIK